jgi:hypothetical protein
MFRALVVVALTLFAFQGEPSKAVRAKLFNQVVADDAELRECLKEQEGGAAAAQENMTVEEHDLNRDGVKEYEVQLSGMCACGAQNCTIYLYRATGQGYESILEGASGLGIEFLRTSTNGYTDLQINAHGSAVTEARTKYKFDGRKYREGQSTVVDLETGESKPSSRRVQFARGSSSATVRGSASLALSDTWLVGARAGQVMTVQLTAPNKSVRFFISTPNSANILTDDTRSWTGTLPDTGDYYIIVQGGARSAPYSMTISIK